MSVWANDDMWRVLAVYLGVYVHVDGFLRCLRKQAVRHTEGEYASRGWSQVYVVAVSRYRVKEAERTWKHSLNFNTRQRNAFWNGDFFVTGASRTIETRNDCAFFFYTSFPSRAFSSFSFRLFFFSLIRSKRKEGQSIWCGNVAFWFSLFFFLYLFLKCTLEDAEADEGGGGAPLSLILTIVSIC